MNSACYSGEKSNKKAKEDHQPTKKVETVYNPTKYVFSEDYILTICATQITYEVTRINNSSNSDSTKGLKRKIINSTELTFIFHMTEVSSQEVTQFRTAKTPSLVIVMDGKMLHSEIPKELDLKTFKGYLGRYICAFSGTQCDRLLAAPDNKGGCAKVRNNSRGIELCSFISKGFETFNTLHDTMHVAGCCNYTAPQPREKTPKKKVCEMMDCLYDLFHENFDEIF